MVLIIEKWSHFQSKKQLDLEMTPHGFLNWKKDGAPKVSTDTKSYLKD